MESCWGEENMKIYTVEVKKAIAKCGHEDAPELSLPPYRSSYRFVNTMVNKADQYENMDNMVVMFAKMMSMMKNNRHNNYNNYDTDSFSNTNSYKKNDPMARMSNFMSKFSSRHTRAVEAKDLDLGDRLVEKLAEQKRHMEAKIGNMTCVLREMNCL